MLRPYFFHFNCEVIDRLRIDPRHEIENRFSRFLGLLTVEEIRRMADCAENVRDKAFIWVYFDSMRRLGEILSLRIGDVEFDDLGESSTSGGRSGRIRPG